MFNNFEIRQVPLSLKSSRQKVVNFLAASELRLEDVDYYAGVFAGDDDVLLAGGGLSGDVLKCIAVSDVLRDTGMSLSLVSHLLSVAQSHGHQQLKVFTKPQNKGIFENFGFHVIATAPKAILMENGNGLRNYCNQLNGLARDKGENRGVIVMNANPFTLGHRYLVEQAATKVDTLFIIVVKEDRSLFSYTDRKAMIEAGVAHIANVVVCEGSDYAISAATFPTYFLKQLSDATDTHITLDLDLFAKHIAPALGATVRFAGSEPLDATTRRYNQLMAELLPAQGIDFVEIERCAKNGNIVCATAVREALAAQSLPQALCLVPHTTVPYLVSQLTADALQQELDTTPKPGLVDRVDCGAHTDMDYDTMSRSIQAIHPYFTQLALAGFSKTLPQANVLRQLGIEAEKAMLAATGGVNTHKGALFSMGLAIVAATHLLFNQNSIDADSLQATIAQLALRFEQPSGTHGHQVLAQNKVNGALASAQNGYQLLFSHWLPYYSGLDGDPQRLHKTLLLIMSMLDDTNVAYRKGSDEMIHVKEEARALLDDFSLAKLSKMNSDFTARNISPGGCADMLSLTIFIYSLINDNSI